MLKEIRLATGSSSLHQTHPNVMWVDDVKDVRFTNATDFSLSNPDSCQETTTCCYYGDTGYQSHMPHNTHLQKNGSNAHLDSPVISQVRRWVRNISAQVTEMMSVNQAQCSCRLWSKKGLTTWTDHQQPWYCPASCQHQEGVAGEWHKH